MNRDFVEGVIVWAIGIISIWFLFGALGRAWVYNDQVKVGMMQACQQNGYTWGECYNVIHGDKNNFDK